MNNNLLNFWRNYEDVINWGYRISGLRVADVSGLTAPINTQTKENITDNDLTDEEYEDDSSNHSLDIDLEYLNFSKKTLAHQEENEREKKKKDREYGLCSSPSSENELDEIPFVEEINPKELYGLKVDQIVRQENELQYKFDSYCSVKKPVLWPCMAFNLSVPEPELHLDLKTPNHPSWSKMNTKK